MITGGTGFIGLTIAQELCLQGENVVILDVNPLDDKLPPNERLEFVQGDARDEVQLADIMRNNNIDAAILTAAVTADLEREKKAARMVTDVNIGSIAAGLQACAAADVKRALVLSSGSAYGSLGQTEPVLKEDAEGLCPENLYGITKLTGEMVARRLSKVYGIDLSIGRLGTCFGPLEHSTGLRDTLSPHWQVMQLANAGEPVILPRPGKRDWLYSKDAATAAIALLRSHNRQHEIYNLGAGFCWSMAEWCVALAEAMPGFKWHIANTDEAANVNFYSAYDRAPQAIDRLLEDTDFSPRFDLAYALKDILCTMQG